MAVTATTFTQTRTIEALPTDGATAKEISEFLAFTGYTVTRVDPNSMGIIHREGEPPASANRKMFNNGSFIVKVDGKFSNVVRDYMLQMTYGTKVA